jgi:hypothetical protein
MCDEPVLEEKENKKLGRNERKTGVQPPKKIFKLIAVSDSGMYINH